MSQNPGKLSFSEKAGYSLGDASAHFVFQTMIIFQTADYSEWMHRRRAAGSDQAK